MKKNILYFECNSGISGDMTVAALLDLGADRKILTDALNSLPLSGYSTEIKDVFKNGIRACDFDVILDKDNHDHDMEYLHGHHSDEHVHTHADGTTHAHSHHSDGHVHTHADGTTHAHSHHSDEHVHTHADGTHHTHHHSDARNLHDVITIIRAGKLTDGARILAENIFEILARAEAYVHGKTIEEVHFHEVGAVDSIVDIVSAAVCIDNLQPAQVVFSPLTDGTGQIRCQHGLIPVPVPAVAAIAMQQGLILKSSNIEGELVTPTGAAIAAAAATSHTLPDEYRIRRIGFGAGKRSYKTSGLLRAMLLEPVEHDNADTVVTLETNIDDCSGEALGYTMQQLLKHGALDVFFTPIFMKKNRPACLLQVICRPQDRTRMESVIFRNTTTIGIRYQEMHRTKLDRRIVSLETPWGTAAVKCCIHGEETFYYPEHDSVAELSEKNAVGFTEMYQMIQAYARESKN